MDVFDFIFPCFLENLNKAVKFKNIVTDCYLLCKRIFNLYMWSQKQLVLFILSYFILFFVLLKIIFGMSHIISGEQRELFIQLKEILLHVVHTNNFGEKKIMR